jgi:hypothetical protein
MVEGAYRGIKQQANEAMVAAGDVVRAGHPKYGRGR